MKTVLPPKRDDFFDPNLNASTFNSNFSTTSNNLTNDLSDDYVIPLDVKFRDISISFICKCLASIKINSSIDILDMDAQLLRISSHALVPSLGYIYNLSLKTGCVPSDFKLARVTPIYKGKGDKSELGNYRPISVVPHLAKILERAVKNQIMNFFNTNNLLTDCQMAYIKGRSIQSALNFISNTFLNNMNKGLYKKVFTRKCQLWSFTGHGPWSNFIPYIYE